MLSIEITRECPLHCPGCYAYGSEHLGGDTTLRELSDFRGDALVEGVLHLVEKHQPLHVSLVGGEPLIRHRELSRILPAAERTGTILAGGNERGDPDSHGVDEAAARQGRGVGGRIAGAP